jgi:hypothetical protein
MWWIYIFLLLGTFLDKLRLLAKCIVMLFRVHNFLLIKWSRNPILYISCENNNLFFLLVFSFHFLRPAFSNNKNRKCSVYFLLDFHVISFSWNNIDFFYYSLFYDRSEIIAVFIFVEMGLMSGWKIAYKWGLIADDWFNKLWTLPFK